jgi:hypothetical protein
LLERSDEYLLWAATQWAAPTQKCSKSRTATAAVEADACHQRYRSEESDQERDHGEAVECERRAQTGEREWVCAECGSTWKIDQEPETLVEARRRVDDGAGTDGVAVADGGEPTVGERWPSARSGARIGGPTRKREGVRVGEATQLEFEPIRMGGGADYCSACGEVEPEGECEADGYRDAEYEGVAPLPPEHFGEHTIVEGASGADVVASRDPSHFEGDGHLPFVYDEPACADAGAGEVEAFERPPKWEPDAVVKLSSGEETEVGGSPGGVDYGEVVVKGAESAAGRLKESVDADHLPRPSVVEGPAPWESGPAWLTEAAVRSGKVPPPEIVAREYREMHEESAGMGGRITPKSWPSDWYERRHGEEGADERGGEEGRDAVEAAVEELHLEVTAEEIREAVGGG